MIKATITSAYTRYDSFDVVLTIGGKDANGNKLYVVGTQRAQDSSTLTLCAESAASIELIAYFIPADLPGSKDSPIEDHPPFDAQITIWNDSTAIYDQTHKVNAWGGSTIKLNIKI